MPNDFFISQTPPEKPEVFDFSRLIATNSRSFWYCAQNSGQADRDLLPIPAENVVFHRHRGITLFGLNNGAPVLTDIDAKHVPAKHTPHIFPGKPGQAP